MQKYIISAALKYFSGLLQFELSFEFSYSCLVKSEQMLKLWAFNLNYKITIITEM